MTASLEPTASLFQQERIVEQYFESFNQGQFETTASLFAETGRMIAPFEEPIVGEVAIAAYLKQEAEDMQAFPQELSMEEIEGGRRQVVVKGRVRAKVFTVNAAWIFVINADEDIEAVRIKLLASLQELVALR